MFLLRRFDGQAPALQRTRQRGTWGLTIACNLAIDALRVRCGGGNRGGASLVHKASKPQRASTGNDDVSPDLLIGVPGPSIACGEVRAVLDCGQRHEGVVDRATGDLPAAQQVG
jgi:hypothetical protein